MKFDDHFLTLSGWIVSILSFLISVGFGIWSIRAQRTSVRDTENIVEKTHEIQSAITTRSIGLFPSYVRDITKLLKNAQSTVVILCDFPAYGCVSDFDAWFDYQQEIRNLTAKRQLTVRFTCLDDALRNKQNSEQFREIFASKPGFTEWRKGHANAIKRLANQHNIKISIDDLTEENLYSLFEKVDKTMLNDAFAGGDIQFMKEHIPLFFWIVDNEYAIFSIPVLTGENVEYGFYSADRRLIDAFVNMESRYERLRKEPENGKNP